MSKYFTLDEVPPLPGLERVINYPDPFETWLMTRSELWSAETRVQRECYAGALLSGAVTPRG